jgi:GNAT superfamily N-acetyltransferase
VSAPIRPAVEGDAESVAALLIELGYPTGVDAARARIRQAEVDPASFVLVAESGSGVTGLLSAQIAPYFPRGILLCRITALVVRAAVRRSGVGRALVGRAVELAQSHGCAGIELTTAEDRRAAHRFYESLEFSRTSVRYLRLF